MPGILIFPVSCFVGLAVGANEVTVAGYVRQPAVLEYTANAVNIGNLASLQWQPATQSWGVIDTAQFWDSVSGGRQLGAASVATPLLIAQYDIARIPASGIDVTYSKINRPYGTGGFGTFGYGTAWGFSGAGVLLERAFGQQTNTCEPGAWTPSGACEPGTWTPGPFPLAA